MDYDEEEDEGPVGEALTGPLKDAFSALQGRFSYNCEEWHTCYIGY